MERHGTRHDLWSLWYTYFCKEDKGSLSQNTPCTRVFIRLDYIVLFPILHLFVSNELFSSPFTIRVFLYTSTFFTLEVTVFPLFLKRGDVPFREISGSPSTTQTSGPHWLENFNFLIFLLILIYTLNGGRVLLLYRLYTCFNVRKDCEKSSVIVRILSKHVATGGGVVTTNFSRKWSLLKRDRVLPYTDLIRCPIPNLPDQTKGT